VLPSPSEHGRAHPSPHARSVNSSSTRFGQAVPRLVEEAQERRSSTQNHTTTRERTARTRSQPLEKGRLAGFASPKSCLRAAADPAWQEQQVRWPSPTT